MSKTVTVSDPLYNHAEQISRDRDISIKDAMNVIAREAGYDDV